MVRDVLPIPLKSTDKYYLNSAYDHDLKYLKFRDYDTTNIDDNLLDDRINE